VIQKQKANTPCAHHLLLRIGQDGDLSPFTFDLFPLNCYTMFSKKKHVTETTPLKNLKQQDSPDSEDGEEYEAQEYFIGLKEGARRESIAADRLSMRLLEVDDDDSATEEKILSDALDIDVYERKMEQDIVANMQQAARQAACERFVTMLSLVLLAFGLLVAALWVGVEFIGPPNQPVGPYELVERQVRPEQFVTFRFVSFHHCTQNLESPRCCFRRAKHSLIFTPFMLVQIPRDRMDTYPTFPKNEPNKLKLPIYRTKWMNWMSFTARNESYRNQQHQQQHLQQQQQRRVILRKQNPFCI
jgi:hypothetical protein